jgi:SAM-dependent methyltransferase
LLTVDYARLGLGAGDRLLDLGCGAGRHAFEALRRGARVTAFDYDEGELKDVAGMAGAMAGGGEVPEPGVCSPARGDATRLPFPDGSFDRIIAAEVLEHIVDDEAALAELARVLKPGGTMAVTVPAYVAERICWLLSDEYHAPFVPGGHVRIYRQSRLRAKLRAAGLDPRGAHHAHGIHAPYWWLRCAVGPTDDQHPLVRAYHQALVWDISGTMPWYRLTRLADRLLSPVVGKSIVVYAHKPADRPTVPSTPSSPGATRQGAAA